MKKLVYLLIFVPFLISAQLHNLERYSWQCQNPISKNNSEEFTFKDGKFVYVVRDTVTSEINKTRGSYSLYDDKIILKTKHKEVVYVIKWLNNDEFNLFLIRNNQPLNYVLSGTPRDRFWQKK
jgi:hypothetical protein